MDKERDFLKDKLEKAIDRMNSRLLIKEWKPRRNQYEQLRNELKEILDASTKL